VLVCRGACIFDPHMHRNRTATTKTGNGTMNQADFATRLQRLEDIEAIRRLKARYCAACDAGHDGDAIATLFAPDGVWEAPGITRAEGGDAIRAYMGAVAASGIRNSAHNVMNPVIDVDGDVATAHWRLVMLYTAVRDGEPRWYRIIGWYRDTLERHAGEWRFRHLFCQVEENGEYRLEREPGPR
jgi:uncharacterized protein (TIGR02246 family)